MRAKSVKAYRFPVNTNKRICSHATAPKKGILQTGYVVGFAAISMRWHRSWYLLAEWFNAGIRAMSLTMVSHGFESHTSIKFGVMQRRFDEMRKHAFILFGESLSKN